MQIIRSEGLVRRGDEQTSRRIFLTTISAGAALLAFSRRAAAQSSVRRKLGVALCGLGKYSSDQLGPALRLTQFCELRGVSPAREKRARSGRKATDFRGRTFITTTRWRGWLKILTSTSSTSSRRTPCMPSM